MKTSLAIALLIAGWTLIYTGFKEPNGNVLTELRAALNPSGSTPKKPQPIPKGAARQ